METQENIPAPPPIAEADGTDDTLILQAISRHPDAAHALAEIARGADPEQVLSDWLTSLKPEAVADPEPEAPLEHEPAIYQSPAILTSMEDSWPACLGTPSSGFWDNPTFI